MLKLFAVFATFCFIDLPCQAANIPKVFFEYGEVFDSEIPGQIYKRSWEIVNSVGAEKFVSELQSAAKVNGK